MTSDLPKLALLFRRAPQHRIGLLDPLSAQRLIINPVIGLLQYDSKAIDKIISISAGHPYFTQAICSALFVQARENNKTKVLAQDVAKAIDDAIELSEAGLIWFREGLMIPEKVVFSAVATSQEKAKQNNQSRPEEALKLLKSFGVETDQLHSAKQNLSKNDFLDADGYKVTVEFVRRWLVKYYPLQSEIWELENLESDACDYFEKAKRWRHFSYQLSVISYQYLCNKEA
ncbi:MAG: hypothetical protein F6K23_18180 [Okeania sp. SIO2C9]|uniref:hypothetical protein n=1 Tax=Okeania sp. SIO2C9 TaxID=2607791 RepID=UPI0013C1695B|nr:hypothetical protein [Okeania sp. SIO2C9]NEQ74801.1 hypothetical protein [Okeania sp. SIO2C9]